MIVAAALLGVLALVAGVVVLSVNPNDECARAERLIASYKGDPKVLMEAQTRLKLELVTHPFSARGWATASHLARVAGDPGTGAYDPKVLAISHDCARKAIRYAPHECDGYVAEGWTYACAGDWVQAGIEASKAAAIAPGDPRVRLLGAAVAVSDHRPAAAIQGFEAAIAGAGADSVVTSDAYERLAGLYADLIMEAAADSCWRQAVAFEPRATRVREHFSRFLTKHGRHDEAIAVAEEVVAMANNAGNRAVRAAARVGKGIWWIETRHQPAQALPEFTKADADQPGDAGIWFNIALAHGTLYRERAAPTERAAAREAIARARTLAPNDPDVRELETMIAGLDSAKAR